MPTEVKKQSHHGRIDIAAFKMAENLAKRDPIGAAMWDNGLGQAVEQLVKATLPNYNVFRVFDRAKKLLPKPGEGLGL